MRPIKSVIKHRVDGFRLAQGLVVVQVVPSVVEVGLSYLHIGQVCWVIRNAPVSDMDQLLMKHTCWGSCMGRDEVFFLNKNSFQGPPSPINTYSVYLRQATCL